MQSTVGEVMTTTVARVRAQTPLTEVVKLLRERGVAAVPVVDEDDHVLGVVSGMDLSFDCARLDRAPVPLLDGLTRRVRGKASRVTAGEAMSSPVVSVTPEVSLRTAARLLQVHGIHHLPVVADGRLVGMVTRRDLLAAFMRGDEQIQRQIVHAVQMTFGLSPNEIDVTVDNGAVRLQGRVDQRSLANEVEQLARAVDGVVSVESKLQWALDDTRHAAASGTTMARAAR
jgi:CBS-domain-containing membrane protein